MHKSWRRILAVSRYGAANPIGPYTELTVYNIPIRFLWLPLTDMLNLISSLSISQFIPKAMSPCSLSLCRCILFSSLSSNGTACKTIRLLLIHFGSLKPGLQTERRYFLQKAFCLFSRAHGLKTIIHVKVFKDCVCDLSFK